MKILITLSALCPLTLFAQVPIIFEAGTPARAEEVNQNFADLDTRLNDNINALDARVTTNTSVIQSSIGSIIISGVTQSDPGVAGAVCPNDRIAISANCECDYEEGSRNFGVLFGCQVVGNGGVAGCFPEGTTFDPTLPDALATITVGCVSATQNDGTPIDPIFFTKGGTSKTQSTTDKLNAASAFESALKSAQDRAVDHRTRLEQQ